MLRTDLAPNDARFGLSDAQAAELMGVSERSVERAKARMREDPKAHEMAKAGTRLPSRLRDEDEIYRRQRPAYRHPAPAAAAKPRDHPAAAAGSGHADLAGRRFHPADAELVHAHARRRARLAVRVRDARAPARRARQGAQTGLVAR